MPIDDSSPTIVPGSRFANLLSSKNNSGPSLKSSNPSGVNGKQMLSSLKFDSFKPPVSDPTPKQPKLPSKRRGLRSTAPKTANLQRNRNERKKFGKRTPYTLKAMLSLRIKCKQFLLVEMEEIDGVFQEGIGEETGAAGFLQTQIKKEQPTRRRKIQGLETLKEKIRSHENSSSSSPLSGNKSSTRPPSKSKAPKIEKTKPATSEPKPKPKPSIKETNNEPLGDDVAPLVKSKNAWKPNAKKSKADRLMGKVKGILNKITFERFDTLSQELVNFIRNQIKTKSQLSKVVSQLFAKTIAEKHFGPLYAELCCQLADLSFRDVAYDSEITFKTALVNQCQEEFENGFNALEMDPKWSEEDKETKLLEAKQRALGTVAFIGQLYMKDLLPDKICRVCLINLVSVSPTDLQIESAYQLLQIIGKKYDSTEKGKAHLDKIFDGLQSNSRMGEGLKQRTKILVSIAKDFRSKNWELNKKVETAKTIDEIHEEFEKERGAGAARGGSRATATFDEYIFDATSKYSKQLKFALSGGCAIRRPKAASNNPSEVSGIPGIDLDKFTVESSAMTEEPEEALVLPEAFDEDEEDDIELMPAEDREKIKDSFIRTFMMKRKEGDKSEEACLKEFVFTVKRMGWPDRAVLVDNILNFTFDMAKDEAIPLGQALNMLCKEGYIKKEPLLAALDEWCEFYSTNEADSPMLNFYFANIFIHLIRDNVITLERINESFKKDAAIDKGRKNKEYGRRAEFLAYLLVQEPELSFIHDDWGLTQEQIEPLKEHYVKP